RPTHHRLSWPRAGNVAFAASSTRTLTDRSSSLATSTAPRTSSERRDMMKSSLLLDEKHTAWRLPCGCLDSWGAPRLPGILFLGTTSVTAPGERCRQSKRGTFPGTLD